MSSLLPRILSSLLVYRYAALSAIGFLSSLGIPVPAAPSTVAAAAFAGQGYLNIFWVMAAGSFGNIFGDVTLYWLVRKFGRKVLHRLKLDKFADSPGLRDVEITANTYKTWVIIASRFQDQATTIVNIIAGLGKIDFRRFFILVVIGDVLQMAFYVTIGYLFSDSWESVYASLGKFSWIITLALAIFFVTVAGKIVKKKFGRKK